MRANPIPRAVLAAFLVAGAGAASAAEPVGVEFSAPDGLMLQGTYWGADRPGPGVLLLHQCNADGASWTPLARALSDAGIHVLTFDFRGFGGSRGAQAGNYEDEWRVLWPAFPGDVDRAAAYLRGMPDVDPARLGVLGASCGGSQAFLLALRDPDVRALGFLSSSLPHLNDEDVAQFHSNRSLPVLAIGAEKDTGTAERMRELFEKSTDPHSKLILVKGELHGVPLFRHDPGLVPSIVAWFTAVL